MLAALLVSFAVIFVAELGDKLIVKQRFIKTGATQGDMVVVTDGLKAGEQIVTSGLLKLRNDAEVTINDAIQPSADANPTPENR